MKEVINIGSVGAWGVSGEFRYDLYDQEEDGSLTLVHASDWGSNLITNQGLDDMTEYGWNNHCILGDGAGTPSESNNVIFGFMDRHNSNEGEVNEALGAPEYKMRGTIVKRFNAGVATGTITNMGMSHLTDGTRLTAHHEVSPAVVKGANQVLDVSYRATWWPDLIDRTSIHTIGGVDYDVIIRSRDIDSTQVSPLARIGPDTWYPHWTVWDGPIGTITESPTGNTGGGTNYGVWDVKGWEVVNTIMFRKCYVFFSLNNGNTATNRIRSSAGNTLWSQAWQCQFTARPGEPGEGLGIPKDYTKELTLHYKILWQRHVP